MADLCDTWCWLDLPNRTRKRGEESWGWRVLKSCLFRFLSPASLLCSLCHCETQPFQQQRGPFPSSKALKQQQNSSLLPMVFISAAALPTGRSTFISAAFASISCRHASPLVQCSVLLPLPLRLTTFSHAGKFYIKDLPAVI